MTEAEKERAAVVAYMRDAISKGYPRTNDPYVECSHGVLANIQDCVGCYDDALEAALQDIDRGDHLTGRP